MLRRAEANLVTKRFWFDCHRLSAVALENLGDSYAAARRAVIAGAALWVRAFPDAVNMTFAGGLPFASELTKEWLASEVASSGGGGGGGGAEGGEGAEVLGEAKALFGGGKIKEALEMLDGLASSARSGRARFRARLAMAQALASGESREAGLAMFEGLATEAGEVGLDRWEPALAAECYRSHLACLRQLKTTDPGVAERTAETFRRLCRVEPLAALKG